MSSIPSPESSPKSESGGEAERTTQEDEKDAIASSSVFGGYFRGAAAAMKHGLKVVGNTRALAFASEGAVAGEAIIPRSAYYGLWGLSGLAILGDITTKTSHAEEEKRVNTAIYNTVFHIPASLVVPALIIHRVVHGIEYSVNNHSYARKLPARARALLPVLGALVSIFPIVPCVDYAAERVLEPTLGKYLQLDLHEHPKDE